MMISREIKGIGIILESAILPRSKTGVDCSSGVVGACYCKDNARRKPHKSGCSGARHIGTRQRLRRSKCDVKECSFCGASSRLL